jgi:heme/copper-type cytochrome/quinol oxidase subunit 2
MDSEFMFISVIIGVVLIVTLGIFIYFNRIKDKETKRTGKYPKGHYMGLGIAMGLPIGLPIGIAMGNIALGPAIGVAIGVAIGASLEKKHEAQMRPLTDEEEKAKEKMMLAMMGLVLLGIVAFVAFMFLRG